MATSKPASAAASVRARPILREPPVMRAAPREVSAKAILVETAEFEVVQSADHDEEDEDGQDRGHEESSGFVPRALERAGLVRKGRTPATAERSRPAGAGGAWRVSLSRTFDGLVGPGF